MYKLTLMDDNCILLHTDGDVIATSDANHAKPGGDPGDWKHFRLMCAALNHAIELEQFIKPIDWDKYYNEHLEAT